MGKSKVTKRCYFVWPLPFNLS